MNIDLNFTHDPALRGWENSANVAGSDFPIQNLPFGVFQPDGGAPRGGVALGDKIIDPARLAPRLSGAAAQAAQAASGTISAALSKALTS